MKRKLFFAAGALLLVAAVFTAMYLSYEKNANHSFFKNNVEALAEFEYVSVPCKEEENRTCTFKAVNVNGKQGLFTILNARYVANATIN